MPSPSRSWPTPVVARWLLLAVLVVVARLTLSPEPVPFLEPATRWADALTPDSPDFPRQGQVEAGLNLLLLMPLAVLLVAALPRVRAGLLLLGCVAVSISVELVQGALLADRDPSTRDVLLNSLGAAVGVLVAKGVVRWGSRSSA